MDAKLFADLFVDRRACLAYVLADEDHGCGWIGGHAPAYFDDKPELLDDDGIRRYFYLTLISPVDGQMLSVFMPDFGTYLKHNVYPDATIKVITHDVSPESDSDQYDMPSDRYDGPLVTKTYLSQIQTVEEPHVTQPCLVQVGGLPAFIQDEAYYYQAIVEAGYQFFATIDEDGYKTARIIHGSDPFCYGAAYLYAMITNHDVTDIQFGFWQNS